MASFREALQYITDASQDTRRLARRTAWEEDVFLMIDYRPRHTASDQVWLAYYYNTHDFVRMPYVCSPIDMIATDWVLVDEHGKD